MGELVPAQAGRAAGPRRQAMTATALRGLSRFADARGIPAGREFLLDYDVIEAFCVAGLAGRASSTRGTYRSALYRLAEARHGPPGQRPTPFAGARAPAPYSPAERAELAAVAAAQRDPVKRSSALAAGGVRHRRGAAARRAGGAARHRRHPARPPGRGSCQRAGRAGGAGHRGLRSAGHGSWPAARTAISCSAPARPTAATRTSSATSPGAWPLTRPRRGCRCAGPGPASSAVTWPRAPRSRCCWPSPGSPRPGRWPATPATSAASAPPRAPCGPAGARSARR